MTNDSDWLPPQESTRGNQAEVIDKLFAIFERDFEVDQIAYDGFTLKWDDKILPEGEGKPEAFWHLIQHVQNKGNDGILDHDKAARLSWVVPMIVRGSRSGDLTVFDYREGNGRIRRYLWHRDRKYVVVLQRVGSEPNTTAYRLVTAFYQDFNRHVQNLQRKFENRVQ